MNYKNVDAAAAFQALRECTPFSPRNLDEKRIAGYQADIGAGVRFVYAAAPVDEQSLTILQRLAEEQELHDKFGALVSGEVMNTGESRMVLHHLLRGELSGPVVSEGRDYGRFYTEQRQRFSEFARRVRAGEERSVSGKPFSCVVQIGIGGSDLGPRAIYLALKDWVRAQENIPLIDARFVSNVDPDDAAATLDGIDFDSTLFVLVSKSGTTQETLTNAQFVKDLAARAGASSEIAKNFVAVTSESSPLAKSEDFRDSFYIDDYIGGRYSSTSAVGGVILSVAFGPEIFERFLSGAHQADVAAFSNDFPANGTLIDAMIGVYLRNVLKRSTTAVLPYSQALSRFPAHLQQLDMESNGKGVNRFGDPIDYDTGPVVFGEPGTNGQHSFYQLLHQGTELVPLQFIGFHHAQTTVDTSFDGSTSQTKLNANLAAQIVAFAKGKDDADGSKNFVGERSSTLLLANQLTPETLGALLAHYENKVMFQGFVWNVNSFDQEGVQLGKVLTKELLHGAPGAELVAYARLLGIT